MRTIKFRGKGIKSNEFVYGDLIHGVGSKHGKMFILPITVNLAYIKNCDPLDGVEVDPETVGQFTGLLDKNGKEIFKGDILFGREEGDGETTAWNFYYEIFYDEKVCAFMAKEKNDKYWGIVICEINEQYEIIGNIFDNPELLKN